MMRWPGLSGSGHVEARVSLSLSGLTGPVCDILQAQTRVEDALISGEEGQGRGRGKEEETTQPPAPVPERPVVPQLSEPAGVLGASEMSQVRAQSMVQRLRCAHWQ